MNAVSKKSWPKVEYTQTQLGGGATQQGQPYPGGLDLTTPDLRLQPGALRDCLNFEAAQFGGYSRIEGYERIDGRASPSAATYQLIQVGTLPDFSSVDFSSTDFSTPVGYPLFTNVPSVGQIVTQAVSGATGTIIAVVPTPIAYIAVTQVTGIFDSINQLTTPGPVIIGDATPLTISLDMKTKAIYTAAAADVYRALIGQPPGSGPIRGVLAMAFLGVDQLFAFRDNAGGTAEGLWQATTGGWVSVPFFDIVSFTAGAGGASPPDGAVLAQGGVTATINRVMWQSGAWAGSAVGQFVITAPFGGNFAAGAATVAGGYTVTLSGVQTAITMLPGGRFEFTKCNFSGQAITRRAYGCDGVNPPFEFDGVTLAPIVTGLSPNAPSHITFHKNFLFISQAASLLYCGVGTPFKWDVIDGGGEIATGDTVTGMITLPGSQTTAALGVYLNANSAFLYGLDPTTFNFVTFNTGIGAVPYSVQNLFDTFFLDALGVVTLKTTLNWGNFLPTTLTKNILPFIAQERGNLTASSVNREKSQYRLFFNDGYALYCTILNQNYLGACTVLFPTVVTCVDTSNLTTGVEVTYDGAENGYVYQRDIGTSFDGAGIPAYFITAWDAIKSPRVLKRFRAASIELQGSDYAEINYGYQLGYNNPQVAQIPPVDQVLNLGAVPHWDSFIWDAFVWDGTGLFPTDVDETGTAENIRTAITVPSVNYIAAFTINSIMHHYSMRRGLRV
jgi:hypothetical protein